VRHDPPKPLEPVAALPTTFEVGAHRVVVTKEREGRWTVAVDGRAVGGSHPTQADAWAAGVHEAYRLDAGGSLAP
jgi:hypothetical protein